MVRKPITVMLVDDLELVRFGIRSMLRAYKEVQIVAEANDGLEALERIAAARPDVVFMDVKMLQLDGIETTRRIKAAYPTTAVIMLTSYGDDHQVLQAVQAGASGYLLKDASPDLIMTTIEAVTTGGILIDAGLLRKTLAAGAFEVQHVQPSTAYGVGLNERDIQVLRLLAEGRTNKEIGDLLFCAEVTVKRQVHGIIAKLQASDRTHAVIVAMRQGLIA